MEGISLPCFFLRLFSVSRGAGLTDQLLSADALSLCENYDDDVYSDAMVLILEVRSGHIVWMIRKGKEYPTNNNLLLHSFLV